MRRERESEREKEKHTIRGLMFSFDWAYQFSGFSGSNPWVLAKLIKKFRLLSFLCHEPKTFGVKI